MDYFSTLTQHLWQLYSNLLPIPCLLCGTSNDHDCICPACHDQLPLLNHACPRCALPLQQTMLCGQCLAAPPEQDASFSLFQYQPPVDLLITNLKYHDKLALTGLFAKQMASQLQERELPQLLIPIPLHPRRLRERGYNQSLELAKQLSKQLDIAVRQDVLTRVKDTLPQASLSFSERKKNMTKAFQLNKTDIPSHIALIDDVLTTGNTVNVAAKTLRKTAVNTIEVWTIARTGKN